MTTQSLNSSFIAAKGGSATPPSSRSRPNVERNFRGEKRTNDTHGSTSDPDARWFHRGAGKEAKLCHMGHLSIENLHALNAMPA